LINIPLVFAINSNYLSYLFVALQSISETLDESYACSATVLHLGIGSANVHLLESRLKLPNIKITCVDLSQSLDDLDLPTRAHYPKEIYLRLWIPELFKDSGKVIYLDADIVVRSSIHLLYGADTLGMPLAGARDPNNARHIRYVEDKLGLRGDSYVNSGVLIFNPALCFATGFRERCLAALDSFDFVLHCPDQDMINIACKEQISMLPSTWNYLWNYAFPESSDDQPWYKDEYEHASQVKHIIHFAGPKKPWDEQSLPDADLFWNAARRSTFFYKVLFESVKRKLQRVRAEIKTQTALLVRRRY
jgi:lipopolysaccharide biosynthesis glycosyltransferase